MAAWTPASELIFFRPVEQADLNQICKLEADGYPPDEAATPEALQYRLTNAAAFFLVAITQQGGKDDVAGYCCGTLSTASRLRHETMSAHDRNGGTLCIHSVCVASSQRSKGIATRLLKAYLSCVTQTAPQVTNIRLICKEALVPLYQHAGFEVVGPSDIVHGKDPWLEMKIDVEGRAANSSYRPQHMIEALA